MTIATTPQEYLPRKYPEVIRYLGSRSKSLNFIAAGLAAVDAHGRTLVDLFAGSCVIAAGFGDKYRVVSNDIQKYSSIIAGAYLRRAEKLGKFDLVGLASDIVKEKIRDLPEGSTYHNGTTLAEFNRCEKKNRSLWEKQFGTSHHLFAKNYSGTWWGAEQCICIDAMREVLDKLLQDGNILEADFDLGMTCLLHAVAEISTNAKSGHYLQYREAKDQAGVDAITKFRRAKLWGPFTKLLSTILSWQGKQPYDLRHELQSFDYRECLGKIENAVVYADPLHADVQYSRAYHAVETLVVYDYPELQSKKNTVLKGRYRAGIYQSPFCNKTLVKDAFIDLFAGVKNSKSDLLLSYPRTDIIDLDELVALATITFGEQYKIWVNEIDYSILPTGGRGKNKIDLDWLIIAKKL